MRQPTQNLRPTTENASGKTLKRVAIMLELEWPYRRHCDVYAGIQQYARERGNWECFLDEFADATLAEDASSASAYDGIIARATPALMREAARMNVPLVNVWFNSPVQKELFGVYSDPQACGRIAAEHLLERGFHQFASLSGDGDRFHEQATESFHQTLQSHGYSCKALRIERQFSANRAIWAQSQKALAEWIQSWRPPIGVYCCFADAMGRYVADACRRMGVTIPDHAALICNDSEPTLCLQPPPSLSSVDMNYVKMGYSAATMLDQIMNGEHDKPVQRFLPPTGITARQSTDFFAVEDELVCAALRFISTNLRKPIGVDSVSAGVFAGRRTLERRFRKVLGRSVAQEIVRLRVERAKRELAASNAPVKSIAQDTGFRDAKRMHEVFLREIGLAPTEYRSRQQAV